jgi:branched-chain amino acid aminotransferase
LHPFNSTFHYGVTCYEGLKAYKNEKGEIRLFRPECNMARFKKSSQRASLPDFDGK